MIEVSKIDARNEKKMELFGSESVRLDSAIEYVAMMCDVELPDDEEGSENE